MPSLIVTTRTWLMFLLCLICDSGGFQVMADGTIPRQSPTRKPDQVPQPTGDNLKVTSHPGVGKEMVQEVLRDFFNELKTRPDLLKGEPLRQTESALDKFEGGNTEAKGEPLRHLRRRDAPPVNVDPVVHQTGQQIRNDFKDQVDISPTDQLIQSPGQVQLSQSDQKIHEPTPAGSGTARTSNNHQNLVGTTVVAPHKEASNSHSQYPIPSGVELIPNDYYYYVYYADGGERDPAVKINPGDYYYYIEGRDTEAPLPVQNGNSASQTGATLLSAKVAEAIKDKSAVTGGAPKEMRHTNKNPKDSLSDDSSLVSNVLNEEKELGNLHS